MNSGDKGGGGTGDYGHLGQGRKGTPLTNSANPKTQPGSRANQEASNSAKVTDFAGSDNYPVSESANATARGSGDGTGQDSRGYVKSLATSPATRKVGRKITRKRM